MELLQDLQKHFQSLVFNINLQYGNMISMNEFLENCQKHALMMQNVVDLFESLSERYLRLEEENRKYKQVIREMRSKYSCELAKVKNDLLNLRYQSQEQGNFHHEEALQIFHAWTYAVNAFENTSKNIVNNMWKSNQELTAKLKLGEKEINRLRMELNNSRPTAVQDQIVKELETQLMKLKKDNESVINENNLLKQSIEVQKGQLQQTNSELERTQEHLSCRITHLQQENIQLKEDNEVLTVRNLALSKDLEYQFRAMCERLQSLTCNESDYETMVQQELESLQKMIYQFQSEVMQELATQRSKVNKLECLTRKLKQENNSLERSIKDTLSSYKRLLKVGANNTR
ncbi:hypothetical protein FDP41_007823 [Naegleria fowleri]|uniref:Uncharacterized protein n=1 Tax=Naegleria fowleri TaxID=5763 RepID=A0A6A5CEI6_NAEFO|nr:uncharacterized protein FDP41_007823 [Naegleria fowleri]KAF0983908.1 hypothetical protein FDP41_007823 [Naegleria fowleri]